MKKTVFILLVFLIGAGSTSAYTNYSAGFRMFYSSLQPYGEWIEIDYDLYAWQPHNVRYSWRPYSNGRWEWTRHGWYWVSYEPYGWATFHYGRWFYDDYYGWLWIPDTEWGPSWVEWRYNNNYIGWAPLPPYAHFSRQAGIYFSVSWNSGYHHWNFVNYRHFHSSRINVHVVNNYRTYNIFNNTKYRTNYYYRNGRVVNGGVNRRFVERNGGYRIKERRIESTSDVSTYRTRTKDIKRNRIVSYKPGKTTGNRDIKVDREKIRRGNVNSSLKREKITVDREEVKRSTVEKRDKKEIRNNVKRNGSVTRSEIEKGLPQRSDNSGKIVKEKWLEVNKKEKSPKSSKRNVSPIKRDTENKSENRVIKSESKTKLKKVSPGTTKKNKAGSVKKASTRKYASNNGSDRKKLIK